MGAYTRYARPVRHQSMAARESLRRGTVQVGESGIFYQSAGSVEQGGHTVVFVHGAGTSSQIWRDQVAMLAGTSYAVAMDLPGHGRSEGRGALSSADYRQFLRQFLDALSIRQPVVLVGHCLGAAAALELAAASPARVSGLILVSCGTRIPVSAPVIQTVRRAGPVDDLWLDLFSAGARETGRRALPIWRTTRPEVRYSDLIACAGFDANPVSARVRAPTMLVSGSADGVTPGHLIQDLGHLMPQASVHLLPGTGRYVMLEEPAAMGELVREFLDALRPPPRPTSRRL